MIFHVFWLVSKVFCVFFLICNVIWILENLKLYCWCEFQGLVPFKSEIFRFTQTTALSQAGVSGGTKFTFILDTWLFLLLWRWYPGALLVPTVTQLCSFTFILIHYNVLLPICRIDDIYQKKDLRIKKRPRKTYKIRMFPPSRLQVLYANYFSQRKEMSPETLLYERNG